MAHHEQFQRLAEDLRRHWEVENLNFRNFMLKKLKQSKKTLIDSLNRNVRASYGEKAKLKQKYDEQLKQEVEKLREQFLEEYKSFCLTNREAYEKEKAYSTALLQALETECVKVTQLQLAVESKEKNENLKEMLISSGGGISYLFSTPPDIENFRSPSTNRSLAPDFNSTLQVTSLNETKPTETDCRRCNSLEIERASWVKEQSNILKSLHQSESEVIRLKKSYFRPQKMRIMEML
ncbi:uncharacterized protein LOC143251575 [Tachypleus tridentatus]|uniref:uncharacterized protein LOC143251575 n=1 Tax=Tachypleus tridentatus TaxID=6853 RepID=UPI003FD5A5F0